MSVIETLSVNIKMVQSIFYSKNVRCFYSDSLQVSRDSFSFAWSSCVVILLQHREPKHKKITSEALSESTISLTTCTCKYIVTCYYSYPTLLPS